MGGVWRAGLARHKLPVSQLQGSNTGQEALARPHIGSHMELTWNLKGIHMENTKESMELKRDPKGIQMEPDGTQRELKGDSHGTQISSG